MAASEAVPDNHDKNSNQQRRVFVLSLEHLVSRSFRVLAIDQSGWSMTSSYSQLRHIKWATFSEQLANEKSIDRVFFLEMQFWG